MQMISNLRVKLAYQRRMDNYYDIGFMFDLSNNLILVAYL